MRKIRLHRKEKGAVLVMVSILLGVVLMFVAMAIDVNLLFASKEQVQHYTRFVALAAIEEYYATDCNVELSEAACHEIRLNRAQVRTRDLSSTFELLANKQMNASVTLDGEDGPPSEGVHSILLPGQWIPNDNPGNGIVGDCEVDGESPPCFSPLASNQYKVNAFKVVTTYPMHEVVKFSRTFLKMGSRTLEVSATATVTPRRAVFLVDTSPSITRETHLRSSPVDKASEYAFYLASDNATNQNTWHDRKWIGENPSPPGFPGIEGTIRGPADSDPQKHFGSDYVKKKTLSDASYLSDEDFAKYHPDPNGDPIYSASSAWYRVDKYDSAEYSGPEPLRSVFEGIHGVALKFRERSVAGDRVSLIFYDSTLPWPRVVKLTNNFDYLLSLTDFDSVGTISSDLNTISDNSLAGTSGREKTIRHKLFPLISSFSDSYIAFNEAFTQLADSAESGVLTSDFIVHIGDGLTNCRLCADGVQRCCADTYSYNRSSVHELMGLIQDEAVPRSIPVHMLLIGKEVAPHTVDIKDPNNPGVCLSESEIRALGYTNGRVHGGNADGDPFASIAEGSAAYSGRSEDNPYYQANADMYNIATMTKGIWGPIRPVRPGSSESACAETECDAGAQPGRRLYDPECRSTVRQIEDLMDEIMAQNPYIIVDVD